MKSLHSKYKIKEYKGFWWIPKDSENQYFGILEIDESGEIFLQLFGNSRNEREDYLYVDHSMMYGICEDNTKITVFNKTRSKGLSAEFFKSSIEYKHCLIGFHIENKSDISFTEIHVNLSELIGWFVQFEVELIMQKKDRYYKEKELYSDEKRKISFCAVNAETSSSKSRRIEMQRMGYLKIEYQESQKYFDIFEELQSLSMLFSILGREAIVIQEIKIPYKEKNIPYKAEWLVNSQPHFRPIINRSFKTKHGNNILVNSFSSIFDFIYKLDDTNKFTLEVLSRKYLSDSSNSRIDFFNIVSAYEAWHRNNISETDDDNIRVYEEVIELVRDNQEIKDWVGSRSILFKGMSLPKRIEYLVEQDNWELIRDKKKFKKIVTSTRNMIAHNLKKSKFVASYIELIVSRNIIHSILEIQFLKTINLPQEFINIHMQNHPVIQNVVYQIEANKNELRF